MSAEIIRNDWITENDPRFAPLKARKMIEELGIERALEVAHLAMKNAPGERGRRVFTRIYAELKRM